MAAPILVALAANPALIGFVLEGAKLALQSFFAIMRVSGKTEVEIEKMFKEEWAEMLMRDPADLPDV